MSYVTLEGQDKGEMLLQGDGHFNDEIPGTRSLQTNAFKHKGKNSLKGSNQTISYLMRNLDVIKNINKFNRISKKSRRRSSFSGIEGNRTMKSPKSGSETPTLSAYKFKHEDNNERPKSERRKREQLMSA